MIFAYLKVTEKILHIDAFNTKELRSKRMRKKNPPNGNIIVNSKGKYNKYDMKVHRDKFNEIKRFYIIGDPDKSHLLTGYEIKTLNPDFMEIWKY